MNYKKWIAGLLSASMLFNTSAATIMAVESAQESESKTEQTQDVDKIEFTDDLGRVVEIPREIKKVLSSGPPSQMVLYSLVPEKMVGWNTKPKEKALAFLPSEANDMAEVGSVFAKGNKINTEEVVKLAPEVIIDLGQRKKNIEQQLDELQNTTGVPVLFFDGGIEDMPALYEKLGKLFNIDTTKEVAWLNETIAMAQKHREAVESKPTTYFLASGDNGLNSSPKGGFAAEVPDYIGLQNVFALEGSETVNWQDVSGEQVAEWHPDTVIFANDAAYEHRNEEPWVSLDAAKNNRLYDVPNAPFGWLSGSVNKMLGIRWLGNLYYPELYDLDMVKEAQEFYKLFYHYDLTEEQARELMAHSTFLNQ